VFGMRPPCNEPDSQKEGGRYLFGCLPKSDWSESWPGVWNSLNQPFSLHSTQATLFLHRPWAHAPMSSFG
jgi:hypothetical protein